MSLLVTPPHQSNRPASITYPTRSIISYAQNREDILLWRALHDVDSGFYIDVGAHDPTALSVTKAFYEEGWSGLNVEPDPFYAEKLRQERPRDTVLQVALGRTEGRTTFFDFGDHGLSTTQPSVAVESLVAGLEVARREVEVRTLASVLAEIGPRDVHFLKIDVEGAEAEVLAGADFRSTRPWVILVEAIRPMTHELTHDTWEPLLLGQDYEFAWFDGLNRYYVAAEHRELASRLTVQPNTCDPFEDAKILRLERQVSELRRHAGRDAPRLNLATEIPLASAPDDAAGLLQIVEAQAVELGRLRRNLAAARALAEQRLALLQGRPVDLPTPRRAGFAGGTFEELQAELRQVQSDISDVLERSRWRRLGVRLGLARRAPWEMTHWAADPAVLAPASSPSLEQIRRARAELARLVQQRGDLGRSRWRRLGQQLGLARRLPWESAAPSAAARVSSSSADNLSPKTLAAELAPAASGYEAFVEYTTRCFLAECRRAGVDAILDVGANAGKFAGGLRAAGYTGHILSFEPLQEAHAALAARAAPDALWSVAPRCALGASAGEAVIHVAGNSYSSSLLPMLERHRSAAPESANVGEERCPVVTLDAAIETGFADPTTSFGLRINTHGFEAEVLRGLERHSGRVDVILCKVSLRSLYEGAPAVFALCEMLAARGYRCVGLGPEFEDPTNDLLLEITGVFSRRVPSTNAED